MGIFAQLKRPAVRVPLLLAAMVACSFWAFHSCRRQAEVLQLLRARHLGFIRLLADAASEKGARSESLGELVRPAEGGGHSAVERIFTRDYASRREFAELAEEGAGPLSRLGTIGVAPGSGAPGREQEIAWSGYVFRMHPSPEKNKDFVIFSWPLEKGAGQLTMAWLSTAPGRIYYTSAPRYAGGGEGPKPEDLGEAPFDGKVYLLDPEAAADSPKEFIRKAEEENGRLWAVEDMPGRKQPAARQEQEPPGPGN